MIAPKNLSLYSFSYSAGKLWRKIERSAKQAGAKTVYAALVLYYALYSPTISHKDRTIIIGALGYFILPIDLIPDFIAGAGYTDDIAALLYAAYKVARNITPEVKEKARAKVTEWFGPDVDESEFDLSPSVDWEQDDVVPQSNFEEIEAASETDGVQDSNEETPED